MTTDALAIATEVRRLIAEGLDLDREEVQPWQRFVENLGIDSLAIVELTIDIEDAFDLDIPDDDITAIHTVQDAIDYVARKTTPRVGEAER